GASAPLPISALSLHDALPISSDCTSPIFGTTYFADRYVFSGTASEEVVISTVAAFVPYLFLLDAAQTQLDAASPGGPVARIPASAPKVLRLTASHVANFSARS